MIDVVSETYRCDWEKAIQLNVMEFLNVYSYYVAKKKRELQIQKESQDRARAKMKSRRAR